MSMKEFEKIIGYDSVKKELEQIADILKNREIYTSLGVSAPKGLLLHGEPGVGKTLMASCTIEASGRSCFICRKNQPSHDFIRSIKLIFSKAAEYAPSIVFLDDMDKFANSDEWQKDAEEYVTVQSCIDEVKDKDVFVLATANNIRNFPDSLLRAGRFDRIIEASAPIGQDAIRIIDHYLKDKNVATDIDAESIARILDGRSCAQLETVINEAGLHSGFARSEKITMEHFTEACLRTIFDAPVKSFDDDEEAPYINLRNGDNVTSQIICHEAGHAVVSEILCPESVTLVSAHSRSGNSGGFTSYYHDPKETPTNWYKSRVISTLGGMAAVEQKFGTIEMGNSRDLNHAFEMVHDMVTNHCTCGFALHSRGYQDSSELLSRQEQAVATEVEKYYRKAKKIISLNADFFEKVTAELAEKKLLHTADIQRIKAECSITPVGM